MSKRAVGEPLAGGVSKEMPVDPLVADLFFDALQESNTDYKISQSVGVVWPQITPDISNIGCVLSYYTVTEREDNSTDDD